MVSGKRRLICRYCRRTGASPPEPLAPLAEGDAVAGISDHQMHATGLRLGREFTTIYNGCDFSSYEPSYAPGEYLAYLGRMSHGKNPLDAIKIAKAVGLPLVLAGRPQNGEEERYFASEVKSLAS